MDHILLAKNHHDIRKKVRDFAEQSIKSEARILDKQETFSVSLTKEMGELGLFGMFIPEEYGGQGLDYLSFIVAVEELARIDGSQAATVAAHNCLGIAPIYHYGTEEQKQETLPGLTTGEAIWAFGLTESNAGSDARNIRTRADLKGDTWIINGSKIFITNATPPYSAGITVLADTSQPDGEKEYSTIMMRSNTEGYSTQAIKDMMLWRASDTSRITFKNCRVPAGNLLGKRGSGLKIMLETLDAGRLSIAAMGLGLAQGAYEMALSYAKKRKQFGKSLSTYQINAFKLADMATKIEVARTSLYNTVLLKDKGLPFTKEAAMIKLYTSEIARDIVDKALQLFGGYGFLQGNDIERFYRDQKLLEIGEGTSEILRLVISRKIGCYS